MRQDAASKFLDQLINNPQLREEFREDPEGALLRAGLELTEHEKRSLASIDWNQVPDQELARRVSKRYF